MQTLKNFIGGELVDALSGKTLDNFSPSTGEVYSRLPDSNSADILKAVQAAQKAFPEWSATPIQDRARFLRKIGSLIHVRREEFAQAESLDTGKPLSLALKLDIPRSAQNFEFFADAATQFSSECYPTDHTAINYTLRSPLGVVGCISPWNLPLYLLTWKIAPALVMGNCVVAKPSEVTPLTAYLLSQVCIEAGLPPGVLNIIHGQGSQVGAALSEHPDVAAISFTGSTRTGAEIARATAPLFKKLSLEMGGKNPNIIFADAPIEEALKGTLQSSFLNQGQICLCGSRIYVERPLYSRFKDALVERTLKLKIGDPLEPTTDQGALVSQAHFEKVLSCIERAQSDGGKILCGGKKIQVSGRCQNGWFIAPTLLENLSQDCPTNQEEIFGPLATLTPFDSEEEVLHWANNTAYGLSASLWTQNLSRAHRFSSQLKAGMVWVNCWMLRDLRTPFGGMKNSGLGREGGMEALHFFTEPKNICIKI